MRKRTWWLAGLMLALCFALSTAAPARGAGLTGGTYAYLINGDEVAFPFDPIQVGGELLLPGAVFERLGIAVGTSGARSVNLRLASHVDLKLTLGSPTYLLDGQPRQSKAAPIRLGGHLFLPAGLLSHFGVEFGTATNLVLLRQPLPGQLPMSMVGEDDFKWRLSERTFQRNMSTKQNGMLIGDFTWLDAALLEAPQLGLPYGERVRLYGMLESHTLVLARITNNWDSPGSFKPSSVVMIDEQRRQVDLTTVIEVGEGDLSAMLAPGSQRRGVLAFPKVNPESSRIRLYYHEISDNLGTFNLPKGK